MKATFLRFLIFALVTSLRAYSQGTFVFDQQSTTNETPYANGAGTTIQIIPAPYGQSFTPSLSAIDFVRLNLNDPNPTNGIGATLFLNLRTGSINGSIAASTAVVILSDGFSGVADFIFSNSVPLTSGQVYYFQPVVQSGDQWNALVFSSDLSLYAGGTAFANGVASPNDFWFREGVIVPEPSSIWVAVLGGFLLLYRRKRAA